MKTYLVGGAVRDTLLGLPVHDRDWVVVGATADELLELGYQQVGKDFPVFLHPETKEEYALARTERKSGSGYGGFTCYAAADVTLEQDLRRRDLTINAIAQSAEGRLFDPFNGKSDLEQRLLRHVSAAFSEDPLRVLRIARFAASLAYLGFTIAPETWHLITEMTASGELNELTTERVWQETEKALATRSPQVYFQLLRDCGALAVLLPEVDNLFGIPAPEKWHPEIDSGVHSLLTLEMAATLSDDIAVRFAALCHDVGKGLTPKENWPHHYGHGLAGVPLNDELCRRLRLPNPIRDFVLLATEFHDLLHKAELLPPPTLLNLFDRIDVWRKPQRLEQMILVSEADAKGRTGFKNRSYPQAQYLRDVFQAVAAVEAKQVVADGFSGVDVRNELYQRRLLVLKQWQHQPKSEQ